MSSDKRKGLLLGTVVLMICAAGVSLTYIGSHFMTAFLFDLYGQTKQMQGIATTCNIVLAFAIILCGSLAINRCVDYYVDHAES